MKSFKVKICGITRPEDALTACSIGADMIGMILSKESPRYVSAQRARDIVKDIPKKCLRVGVFVNEDVGAIIDTFPVIGLDLVQLHGDESEIEIELIRKSGVKVIKGFNVTTTADYQKVLASSADYVLIDNRDKDRRGGTGKTFDWTVLPPRPIPNLVLAGGLNSDNVAEGVSRFAPAVLDVSSGVESEPGIKSPKKLKQFFEECERIRHGR